MKYSESEVSRTILLLSLFAMLASVTACGGTSNSPGNSNEFEEARSTKQRIETPDVSNQTLEDLARDNAEFGEKLHDRVIENKGDKNVLYSPYSVSVALSMTHGGAEGETESEMKSALNFELSEDKLYPAFNATSQHLNELGSQSSNSDETFTLNVVNGLWTQNGFPFKDSYLDLLAQNYGAGLKLANFREQPDAERERINAWVADKTEDKIKDLFPQGTITNGTRLVLANAVYFNAKWASTFDSTSEGTFNLRDGSTTDAKLMEQTNQFKYLDDSNAQYFAMPYKGGDVSFVVALPDKAQDFDSFEESFKLTDYEKLSNNGSQKQLDLSFPKFEYKTKLRLKEKLKSMGIKSAFTDARSNFTGMSPKPEGERLFIQSVVHQAYIAVDEEGTEAAAATGVSAGIESAPGGELKTVKVDRPFLFAIRDNETGTILFSGRVINPAS